MPVDHLATRRAVLGALRQELVGPAPAGAPIDCSTPIVFETAAEAYKPRTELGTGEEILQRDNPGRRYGVGVLYPRAAHAPADGASMVEIAGAPAVRDAGAAPAFGHGDDGLGSDTPLDPAAAAALETMRERAIPAAEEDAEDPDLDLSGANTYQPSSMAVSFLADLTGGESQDGTGAGDLWVRVSAGRYRRFPVTIAGKDRVWWVRTPLAFEGRVPRAQLIGPAAQLARLPVSGPGWAGLDVAVEILSRPQARPGERLLTVCLVNRTPADAPEDEHTLFQVAFRVTAGPPDAPRAAILPYPGPPADTLDDEEAGIDLLYRDVQTFGVGHGCAADWDRVPPAGPAPGDRASAVRAECLPTHETPSMTPDAEGPDGRRLDVPMRALAGWEPASDGLDTLAAVVTHYEAWVDAQAAAALPARYRAAADRHLAACRRCAARMRDGLRYLREDARAAEAFRLANRAILLQQLAGGGPPRAASANPATKRVAITPAYVPPDPDALGPAQGRWRAFQIAFLLMSLRSAADGANPDRATVELIWFPTGGGKTEAYLGLAAFSVFMRRLADPTDTGTHVLTRYTLRLLTAQQFQRAARLVCAMEQLRRERPRELGQTPVSIGVWLGGDTTPNRREDALDALRRLQRGDRHAENPFLLDRCPWCKAPMGPVGQPAGGGGDGTHGGNGRRRGGGRRGGRGAGPTVLGYEQRGGTVVLCCPDPACPFAGGLPVHVTDDDIYAERPTVVVGTVDKFAMLAWRPEARALFGLEADGTRALSPPGLIIQDELHLIAGPLGSMVGLYELVIEELCTDRRGGAPVRPKVVCSTATIRRYAEQVKALFNRDSVTLFPPPGLDAGDSFFARYEREADGTLAPGRCYVGVHGPGLGSLQTAQVRTLASLLQGAVAFDPARRDPWWTLLVFFNSLRELGGTLSLIQSDIPDYLAVLQNRLGLARPEVRRIREVLELTSRLRSDEVPRAIAQLETDTSATRPVDICLASNIIEVGVDIDRLSLMAVVGQPKTTAQYIQVTGRVGRRTRERPGLVVTIYSASKARDRSHYEKFRGYHERLYAQVEPTSVTPFSRPVVERALHGAMVAFVRQTGDAAVPGPSPYPAAAVGTFHDLLRARVAAVDPAELARFDQVFSRRTGEWQRWAPSRWADGQAGYDPPLLRFTGAYADDVAAAQSWPTPSSMRNVDAQCQMEVSALYHATSAGAVGDARGGATVPQGAPPTGTPNGSAPHV